MRHLRTVQMSYWTHMRRAWTMALQLLGASMALFVHGAYPDVFEHTGSNIVSDVYKQTKH